MTSSRPLGAELFIVSPTGTPRKDVLDAVTAALGVLFGATRHGDQTEHLPSAATALIVVVDGWGNLDAREALGLCRVRFPHLPRLGVLADCARFVVRRNLISFVTWPASEAELVAKAQSIVRAAHLPQGVRVFIDGTRQTLECNDVTVVLSGVELALVRILLRQSPRWCNERDVIDALSGEPVESREHFGSGEPTKESLEHLGSSGLTKESLEHLVRALRERLGPEGWRLRAHHRLGHRFELGPTPVPRVPPA